MNTVPMISTFIFDWSGTLSDDFDMVYRATAGVVADLDGGYSLSEEEYREHFELPYMRFYKNYGLHVTKKQVDDLFFRHIERNRIKPTVFSASRRVLENLRKNGKKTFLFSAHPVNLVDREIADYGFSDVFDGIEAGVLDKVVSLKKFVKKNHLDPKSAAYVGDLVHDIEAAKEAGVVSVGVLSRYQSREKLLSAKPDVVLNNLEDLLTL